MTVRATDWLLAVAGGVLLTLMTQFNGELAHHSTAVYAAWAAHAIGALVAFALVAATARTLRKPPPDAGAPPGEEQGRTPLWFYLGGIPGAVVVILSAIAVNSSLELSGTIALMLTGQVLFGIAGDRLGLLRIPKRRITAMDLATAGCVLAGSVLIVVGA
ncbi:DMT family transporter [Streptomyces sp. NBC_01465]|uniref:DMT family transporter n=1 Tax=Streptomyces sp. NBC_01465 TaxID=2903878 RepID=UPI002E314993|nr:DMT family transporter [Streptomyces sp. NBC_01465]